MDTSENIEVLGSLLRKTSKVFFSYDIASASVTYLNAAFSYTWNRTRDSVLKEPATLLDTIHPEDREFLFTEYQELLQGSHKQEIEFRIILPDDTVSWLQLDPQLVTTADGRKYITGIVEDITARKDNIWVLQKFAAKKNSVLEILSHDLAGHLAGIQTLAEHLYETTENYKDEEVNNVIRIIQKSSSRSVRMIRDFVQQEFLESSQAELLRKRIDLNVKIKEIIDQYQEGERLIKKEILYRLNGEKFYAYIDEDKFMQVINNLISNAIKFTHDDGMIAIELTEKESTMLVTVKDNGIGIPRHFHEQLFEKFTPARREGIRGEPSTGLGMSIIKTIVEWHNGTIWFESEENAGSTFYIEIPKE